MATVVLDTHGFTAYLEELMRLSGKTWEEVLLNQAAAILKICLRRTPAASVAGIVKRVSAHNNHIEFEDGAVLSFWKKAAAHMFLDVSNFEPSSKGTQKPTRAPRLVNGRSWHEVEGGSGERRWSDERWARYKGYEAAARTKMINEKAAKGARGLSKQSWQQIADALGIRDIGAPGYVRNAKPSNGKIYRNGTAQKVLSGAAYFLDLMNDSPLVVKKLKGAEMLQGAIDTRLKAFAHEMRTGVFEDMVTRAKRYPGLFSTN